MNVLELKPAELISQMIDNGITLPSNVSSTLKGFKVLTEKQIYQLLIQCASQLRLDLDNEPLYYLMNDRRILLVRATAGAGKTTITCLKIDREIRLRGTAPSKICILSFNTASVADLKYKYRSIAYKCNMTTKRYGIYTEDTDMPNIRSLNSLTFNIVKQYHTKFGIGSLDIISSEDSRKTMNQVLLAYVKDGEAIEPTDEMTKNLISLYDILNESMCDVQSLANQSLVLDIGLPTELIARLLNSYRVRLKIKGSYHHSDPARMIVELCKKDESFREEIGSLYELIVIDELQDVSESVYQLLCIMVNTRNKFFAIGDGDQSIYKFKGARPNNCELFANDFPEAELCFMSSNRRCATEILDYAKCVLAEIKSRPYIDLRAIRSGGSVSIHEYSNKMSVVDEICSYLKTTPKEKLGEICIGYRKNVTCFYLVSKFMELGIPFRIRDDFVPGRDKLSTSLEAVLSLLKSPSNISLIVKHLYKVCGVVKFPKKPDSRDNMNMEEYEKYLEDLMDEEDYDYFYEIPVEKIGVRNNNKEQAQEHMDKLKTLSKMLRSNRNMSEIIPDLFKLLEQNYWNFTRHMTGFQKELEDLILEDLCKDESYVGMRQKKMEQEEKIKRYTSLGYGVQLSTFHSLKGLEYDEVFLIELENDCVPLIRVGPQASIEEVTEALYEELRLFYVAVTRAKNKLHLYWSIDKPSVFMEINDAYREKCLNGLKINKVEMKPLADIPLKPLEVQPAINSEQRIRLDISVDSLELFKDEISTTPKSEDTIGTHLVLTDESSNIDSGIELDLGVELTTDITVDELSLDLNISTEINESIGVDDIAIDVFDNTLQEVETTIEIEPVVEISNTTVDKLMTMAVNSARVIECDKELAVFDPEVYREYVESDSDELESSFHVDEDFINVAEGDHLKNILGLICKEIIV